MQKRLSLFLLAALLLAISFPVLSGTKTAGDYTVYYNVIKTEHIPPQVADAQGIKQQKNLYLLSVTLQKPTHEDPSNAIPADVSGEAKDLLGNKIDLDFRRIKEPKTTYNVATFKPTDKAQTLSFTITVKAEGKTVNLKFNQKVEKQ